MSERDLIVCCLSPGTLPGPSIATAACRAGAVGLIDLTLCRNESEKSRAAANLRRLLEEAPTSAAMGVRISLRQLRDYEEFRNILHERPCWTILTDWQLDSNCIQIRSFRIRFYGSKLQTPVKSNLPMNRISRFGAG